LHVTGVHEQLRGSAAGELNLVRLEFMNEFAARFPGYGKGRATWR
jgi:hypothetical protein